jgi:3-oxoacyl-[acyl-carrier-protein] synthase-3
MTRTAQIVSTARYVPERRVTNEDMTARFTKLGIPDVINKFGAASGITQRFYAPEDWACSDLALPAAKEALKRANLKPEDVDLIVLGTDSPDYITPDTSVVLQYKLGAKNAGTFDVGCACASFPTALGLSAGLISANKGIKTVLVVAAYMMHKLADLNDPVSFFYGDGSGAAVLHSGSLQGFVGAALQADGSYHSNWGIFSGGTFEPASEESIKAGRTKVKLLKPYPPDVNEGGWERLFNRLAAENNYTAADVDQVLFTQVNKNTIKTVAGRIGVPFEKCHTIMEKYGYTGSACIAMALDDAIENGKIKRGDLVVMIGSGVGYNQAGVTFRMS